MSATKNFYHDVLERMHYEAQDQEYLEYLFLYSPEHRIILENYVVCFNNVRKEKVIVQKEISVSVFDRYKSILLQHYYKKYCKEDIDELEIDYTYMNVTK